MSNNGSHHETAGQINGHGDDPMTHMRRVVDQAMSDLDQVLARSKRAIAQADAALKMGSK